MVVAPVLEKWADVEEIVRKLLESHRWQRGVLFADEVFVVPVTVSTNPKGEEMG